jgi:hypothetical protein
VASDLAVLENRAVAAANAVLAEPLRQWLERARWARIEERMCTEVLHALVDDPDLNAGLRDPRLGDIQRFVARKERIAALTRVLDAAKRFLMNVQGDVDATEARATVQAWRSFRMRLREDADVEMSSSAPFR